MPTATHPCPAGCGREVSNDLFACKADWFRLPSALRQPISANFRRDAQAHAEAMQAARRWYREHPASEPPVIPPPQDWFRLPFRLRVGQPPQERDPADRNERGRP